MSATATLTTRAANSTGDWYLDLDATPLNFPTSQQSCTKVFLMYSRNSTSLLANNTSKFSQLTDAKMMMLNKNTTNLPCTHYLKGNTSSVKMKLTSCTIGGNYFASQLAKVCDSSIVTSVTFDTTVSIIPDLSSFTSLTGFTVNNANTTLTVDSETNSWFNKISKTSNMRHERQVFRPN